MQKNISVDLSNCLGVDDNIISMISLKVIDFTKIKKLITQKY